MLSSLHPYNYWEEDGQYFFNTPQLFLSLFVWNDNPYKEQLIAILDEYCDDLLQ